MMKLPRLPHNGRGRIPSAPSNCFNYRDKAYNTTIPVLALRKADPFGIGLFGIGNYNHF
jgi:hypothetical protein